MAKYIDMDKLLEDIEHNVVFTLRPDKPSSINAELRGARKIIDRIQCAPAADVVEVRHGRWIKARGSWVTPGGDPVWECSECGKGRHCFGIEHGTYGGDIADGQWISCPNCGAKMDGGASNG